MKKYLLSVAAATFMSFAADAVNIMKVEQKDGSVTNFDVEYVKEVTFDNSASSDEMQNSLDAAKKEIESLKKQLENCSGNANEAEKYKGYGHVDLGLTSGNIWSTANLGADDESAYGGYFAWGEMEPKTNTSDFTKSDYRFWDTNNKMYTKYCEDDMVNFLQPTDDPVRTMMGGTWRMPTVEDFQELIDECSWKWVKDGDKVGALATGPNGNTIFFPVAGHLVSGSSSTNLYIGAFGYFWTKNLSYGGETYARIMRIGTDILSYANKKPLMQNEQRYNGISIRAVSYK